MQNNCFYQRSKCKNTFGITHGAVFAAFVYQTAIENIKYHFHLLLTQKKKKQQKSNKNNTSSSPNCCVLFFSFAVENGFRANCGVQHMHNLCLIKVRRNHVSVVVRSAAAGAKEESEAWSGGAIENQATYIY